MAELKCLQRLRRVATSLIVALNNLTPTVCVCRYMHACEWRKEPTCQCDDVTITGHVERSTFLAVVNNKNNSNIGIGTIYSTTNKQKNSNT